MKVYSGFKPSIKFNKPIVTIGVFDGIHLGHQKLFTTMTRKARSAKKKAVVVTFSPHPRKVINAGENVRSIMSLNHRIAFFQKYGFDICIVVNFDKKFAKHDPASFIKHILSARLNTGTLFIGEDFRLGKDRAGDAEAVKNIAKTLDMPVFIVKSRKMNRKKISSTLIRKYILHGDLKKAQHLLGRNVSVMGTVVKGDKIGRCLGIPTANLDLHHELAPPSGVYAVFVRNSGTLRKGIANIGSRPTISKSASDPRTEVHVLDFKENLYGEDLEVIFIKKIRNERHFKTLYGLRQRINGDILKARSILRKEGTARLKKHFPIKRIENQA